MNFFKKILGFEKDLSERIKQFKARGTLFQVVQTTRNVKLQISTITFAEEGDKYKLQFKGDKQQEYQLPIHLNMNVFAFTINKAGKQYACFEWQLQQQTEHVGCYMQPEFKQNFKEILCLILKKITKDQHIKDHLVFCKELAGIPVYKTQVKTNKNVSSGISTQQKHKLNDILIQQAQKQQNKMVHTCSYYHVQLRERKLILQSAIFVLKSFPNYQYQFQVINPTGYISLKKNVDSGLNYEVNVDKGYIRWIDIDHDCRIIQVNFEGKRDAALSLKYNMFEVMYELRSKRKIEQDATSQQIAYMKKISQQQPKQQDLMKTKICQIYQQKQTIQQIGDKKFFYQDLQIKQGVNYNNFCQAKINDFSIASLGSLMETLHISEDSYIKQNDKKTLYDLSGKQVNIGQLLLYDSDSKAFIRSTNGKLYYQDLNKSKLIQEYEPTKKGIVSICPEYKLADVATFKTFKAISQNAIYEIDPRIKEGVGSLKQYSGNPNFTAINATGNGSFVTGAKNGEIRFFKQIGKNASNKFTSVGDPVIHLDTTKDGKWVLATFRRYLRLIPTQNDDEASLFEKKISFNERPTPIKLQISLQDLQEYGIRDFSFLPAKFDQSKESIERFIISGFGQYTVIWNLGKAIKGDRTYLITKGEGKVVQADFRFNDPTKLIMATNQGILVKQNKIKK